MRLRDLLAQACPAACSRSTARFKFCIDVASLGVDAVSQRQKSMTSFQTEVVRRVATVWRCQAGLGRSWHPVDMGSIRCNGARYTTRHACCVVDSLVA